MIQQDHEKEETMLPCEGPGRDIMSVRVRHIPMARGGGGGPTKSITRFDRLDCGPVAAIAAAGLAGSCRGGAAAGAGKEGEGHRNLIFVPWSDLESSSLTSRSAMACHRRR